MSKATSEITSRFKNTYVLIGNGPDEELQKAMFAMGFRWGLIGDVRKVNTDAMTYISVDKAGTLWYPSYPRATPNTYTSRKLFVEVSRDSVFEAAEQVKLIKRQESKASKKRRAHRKWLATSHPNDGIGCPVRHNAIVTIRLRNGNTHTMLAEKCDWRMGGWPGDIMRYKVVGYKKEKAVSQEAMVTDIAASLGKGVVAVSNDDDWIEWNGGECPVAPGTEIEFKYRNAGYNFDEGFTRINCPELMRWSHVQNGVDIVAYRLVNPCKSIVMETAPAHDIGHDAPIPVQEFGEATEAAPDTNPKRQYGVQSIPLNMWSSLASAYGALGLYNGSLKYGKANYANTPVEASIYIAAAQRHLAAWAAGEEFDPADGVPNLGGVLANIAILLEARAAGTLIDDRIKQAGYLKERDALKDIVKSLNELHAGKNPKHYTLGGDL